MCDCNKGMGMGIVRHPLTIPMHRLSGLGDGGSIDTFGMDTSGIDTSLMTGDNNLQWSSVPTITSPTGPNTSTSNINWNSILGAWTQAGTQIAKASAGALPTYQAITPQGSVTMFGSPGGNLAIPGLSLPGFNTGSFGIGTILLIGGAVLLFAMMGKR